ncbi:MAG: glutamate--tRNA ligase [Actinomycetota bacterium]|nr:glutamate--tRNA ligase [Actinomycetota bacterium]
MPRLRFAPSPTGGLHIGTARTALFNWLAAKSLKGHLILRIEDTDAKRSKSFYEKSIIRDLEWLGLEWDEFYRQSDRIKIYGEFARKLLDQNKAYRCFCTPERLEKLKEDQYAAGKMSKYDNRCRELSPSEIEKNLKEGKKFAIRFRVNTDREITFNDLIRGRITFSADTIGDFIIIKSDGMPSYNFAVVVDDGDMKITHVLRGEDHITNTARQILLFESLGFRQPFFAHLSMILGRDGSKLSKRHGATTISEFREEGYLAEAMTNYLSLLSWSPGGDEEIFNIRDVIDKFRIQDISRSPAIFDVDKLKWINGIYIRKKSPEELADLCIPYLIRDKIISREDKENPEVMRKILRGAKAFRDNLKVLGDFSFYMKDFFSDVITDYSAESIEVLRLDTSKVVIDCFLKVLESRYKSFDNGIDIDLNEEQSRELINLVAENLKGQKIKGRLLYMPIRVSLTGKTHGPELPDVISIIGLKNSIQRVKQTLEYIKSNNL